MGFWRTGWGFWGAVASWNIRLLFSSVDEFSQRLFEHTFGTSSCLFDKNVWISGERSRLVDPHWQVKWDFSWSEPMWFRRKRRWQCLVAVVLHLRSLQQHLRHNFFQCRIFTFLEVLAFCCWMVRQRQWRKRAGSLNGVALDKKVDSYVLWDFYCCLEMKSYIRTTVTRTSRAPYMYAVTEPYLLIYKLKVSCVCGAVHSPVQDHP